MDIDDLKALATKRGGTLISDTCVHRHAPLSWQCSKGHTWEASPHAIRTGNGGKGTWCPECNKGGRPSNKSIDDVSAIVKGRGGAIVSGEYRNNRSKFQIVCVNEHEFTSDLLHLSLGKWCPHCAPNQAIDYDKVVAKAAVAGLTVVSSRGEFDKHAVPVRCNKCGHEDVLSAYRINEGRGCGGECRYGKGWETRRLNVG